MEDKGEIKQRDGFIRVIAFIKQKIMAIDDIDFEFPLINNVNEVAL